MLGKGFRIGLEVIMRGIRSDTCPDSHIPFFVCWQAPALLSGIKVVHKCRPLYIPCGSLFLFVYLNPCTVLLYNPVPFTSI